MTLKWKKVSEDEIAAEAGGYGVVIRRENAPRKSPFILVLNGAEWGYYDDLDYAQARADRWLQSQRAFDSVGGS